MSRRVFVAGATGVLGRRVVPALVAAGHTVTANVRNPDAARRATEAGATPTTIDLFDSTATQQIGDDHDAVVNVATSIPSGASAALKRAWKMNDRLRRDAASNLAAAVSSSGGRYVGESITFPYVDAGDEWIDEGHPRTYFSGNETCRDAEAAAGRVTAAGGAGVILRFAMFFANDSAHVALVRSAANRGVFALPGAADSFVSWIDVDDAAAAVVAALGAPAGVYNVAEPDPVRKLDHAEALARAVGRNRLRHVPRPLARLGGEAVESLARSQRISAASLSSCTDWTPRVAIRDAWAS